MNVLLVYPKCLGSFWNYSNTLKLISKKVTVRPPDLNRVSEILPDSWSKRMVDLNIAELEANDIQWADYVFISAMYIQKRSVDKIIIECKKYNKKVVAGGPLFTKEYGKYLDVDHFILNDIEITLPLFLADLKSGQPQIVYTTRGFANISQSPVPYSYLLSLRGYTSLLPG